MQPFGLGKERCHARGPQKRQINGEFACSAAAVIVTRQGGGVHVSLGIGRARCQSFAGKPLEDRQYGGVRQTTRLPDEFVDFGSRKRAVFPEGSQRRSLKVP